MNLVGAFAASAEGRHVLAPLGIAAGGASLVITPRYPDSRHVVVLLLDRDGQARAVAKVVRAADDVSTLSREARILAALEGTSVRRSSIPRLLAFTAVHGHWMLVQTAVEGRAITHLDARRRPDRWWALVEDWLTGMPVHAPGAPEAWCDSYIGAGLALAEQMMKPTHEESVRFLATEHYVGQWGRAGHATVVEHGDLSHPNLMWSRARGLAIVDWETGHTRGVIGADAAVFLTFMEFAKAGVHAQDDEAEIYRNTMLRRNGSGRRMLGDYLAHHCVAERWIDHVLLAAWSRIALAVFPRLGAGGSSAESGDRAVEMFRGSRSTRLWALTADRFTGR